MTTNLFDENAGVEINEHALVAVEADLAHAAGAMSWWTLRGAVDLEDFIDELALEGHPEELYPSEPSIEVVVKRAAESCVSSAGTVRTVLRPLKSRASWEIVREEVVVDDGTEKLQWTELVRVTVERQEDGSKLVDIKPYTEADRPLAEQVLQAIPTYKGVLMASDVSSWLLWMLNEHLNAVCLRDRGGVYFVPREEMERWTGLVGCLKEVAHPKTKVYKVPAMKHEDTVEAILDNVRHEVETAMAKMETYLSGDTSTRGLNSEERKLDAKRVKAARYAELLGVALPDLTEKAVLLQGMINAARLQKDSE